MRSLDISPSRNSMDKLSWLKDREGGGGGGAAGCEPCLSGRPSVCVAQSGADKLSESKTDGHAWPPPALWYSPSSYPSPPPILIWFGFFLVCFGRWFVWLFLVSSSQTLAVPAPGSLWGSRWPSLPVRLRHTGSGSYSVLSVKSSLARERGKGGGERGEDRGFFFFCHGWVLLCKV